MEAAKAGDALEATAVELAMSCAEQTAVARGEPGSRQVASPGGPEGELRHGRGREKSRSDRWERPSETLFVRLPPTARPLPTRAASPEVTSWSDKVLLSSLFVEAAMCRG